MPGISPDFENDRDKGPARQGGLGKPQGIVQLAWRGVKNIPVAQSELFETNGIGNSGLLHGDDITDPEERRLARLLRFEVGRQRESKAACCPGIPHQQRADFRDAVERQTAFQCGVHLRYAEWQTGWVVLGCPAFRIGRRVRLFRRGKRRQRFSFQSGDLFAQGKKRLLRRGVLCHGVSSIRNVLFMFLWIPELPIRVNNQILGIFSWDPRPMILHSKNIAGGTIWA
ncbi:Hypothetical protein NGAL_HAMBI1146_51500 [Neorhizobium galegae bv. officinalis]|nr:Hypothetical protein NGAL_HAMBI1146_51500 [Neorhizobium galegae bv. officinalis]